MSDPVTSFGVTAKSLARNPLGIIALFIVLVYGFASMVTAATGPLAAAERLPLIYFLVLFPVLVLGTFGWLVRNHHEKRYGPGDFPVKGDFLKIAQMKIADMRAVVALSDASAKSGAPASEPELVSAVLAAGPASTANGDSWMNHILWVDDRPENNTYERQAFEALGLRFTLAHSTDEAFERLAQTKFTAIISDMGRREGPREGYVLLDRLRLEDNNTPLFFYASSNSPEHKRETRAHGGQGCTNNAQELFEMVTRSVIQRKTA